MDELSLFVELIRIADKEARDARLAEACGADSHLKARVEELLRAHDQASRFLETSALMPTQGTKPNTIAPVVQEKVGALIGPYKLLQAIGEGGMGTVFLAEQTKPVERRVALKIIKAGMDSKQVIARFEAERQALAMMDHPNIARVLDAGTTESGNPYFVMELVKGVPITTYCDENKLGLEERLRLLIPVCHAIQHAHQKGIIHRDIKPTNVLVAQYDGQPVPKVIDFGIAKATSLKLTDRTMFTEFGQVVGTLEYMSPEQAEFNQLDIDTRSDVYSLGVLLYELLTGSTPLDNKKMRAAGFLEVLRMIREEEPLAPSHRLSTVDTLAKIASDRKTEPGRLSRILKRDLDWIVMMALEKDRSRRYETANSLAMDLQRFLNNEPVIASPPSASYRLRKFARRNKLQFMAALLVAGALCLGLATTSWQAYRATIANRESKRQESLAKNQLSIANAVTQFLQKDILEQASVSSQLVNGFDAKPEITVREALERAANNLHARFTGLPQVEAAICLTLGKAYLALGQYSKAVVQLERSVQLRTEQWGEDHSETLESKVELVKALSESGESKRAIQIATYVFEHYSRQTGMNSEKTLQALEDLALAHLGEGAITTAVGMLEKVRDTKLQTMGPEDLELVTTLQNLANAYQAAERTDEAIEILQGIRKQMGTEDEYSTPQSIELLNSLAHLYIDSGNAEEGTALLQRVCENKVKVLGPQHIDVIAAYTGLAATYLAASDEVSALNALDKVQKAVAEHEETDHPTLLEFKLLLAEIRRRERKFQESIELNENVRDTAVKRLGLNHRLTLECMNNLAIAYCDAERIKDAIETMLQVAERTRETRGEAHQLHAETQINLAGLYQRDGQIERAEKIFKQVVEQQERNLGSHHLETLEAIGSLASFYWHTNRPEKSVALVEPIIPKLEAAYGELNVKTLFWVGNLGMSYANAKRYQEAIPLLEKAYNNHQGDPNLQFFNFPLINAYKQVGNESKIDESKRGMAEDFAQQQSLEMSHRVDREPTEKEGWVVTPENGTIARVLIDARGDLFITGSQSKLATFGDIILPPSERLANFYAKLDARGKFLWARKFEDPEMVRMALISHAALDSEGDLLTAGVFFGSIRLGQTTLTSDGEQDGYVAKIDGKTGEFLWCNRWGGPAIERSRGMIIDSDNNLVVFGDFTESLQLDSTNLTSAGDQDGFVAKVDGKTGKFLWGASVGGPEFDSCRGAAFDSRRNVAVVGGRNITDKDTNSWPKFAVTKFDSSGNIKWEKSGNLEGFFPTILVGEDDSLFVGGSFSGTVDLPTGRLVCQARVPGHKSLFLRDGLILKLDSDGNLLWTRTLAGEGAKGNCFLANGADSKLYASGTYQGNIACDVHSRSAIGIYSFYIAQIDAKSGSVDWLESIGMEEGKSDSVFLGLGRPEVDSKGKVHLCLNIESSPQIGERIYESKGKHAFVFTFDGQGRVETRRVIEATNFTQMKISADGERYVFGNGIGQAFNQTAHQAPQQSLIKNGFYLLKLPSKALPKFVVVDDSIYDRTFQYSKSGELTIDHFSLENDNFAPCGTASNGDGTSVWVADKSGNVFAYGATGIPRGKWGISSLPAEGEIEGIAVAGSDLWILEGTLKQILRYAGAATRKNGSQAASSSFTLHNANSNPKGMACDGSFIWVVNDGPTDQVFKYGINGTYLGVWELDPDNQSPSDIAWDPTSDGDDLWVIDDKTDKLYRYAKAGSLTSGSHKASESHQLAVGNASPQGIAILPEKAPLDLPRTSQPAGQE